jgi:glycosyltransferase involved in cell wall biosynthesis
VKKNKPKILIFADYYLPGYKSGGGMRTIVNMVDRLHDRYDFLIVTRDHDGKLDKTQYTTVKINQWNSIRNAQVYYLDRNSVKISKLRELILEQNPDIIYLNSYFATLAIYVLKLRKFKQIPYKPIILAPCGELSVGALQFRKLKKTLFMNYAKLIGLYDDIIWKATTEIESEEINQSKGKNGQIIIAADMPAKEIFPEFSQNNKCKKQSGSAKLAFVSRINPKKNLHWLFDNLKDVQGNLTLDIIGPIDDQKYWKKCEESLKNIPQNVKINLLGSIPHEQISDKLLDYHYFILPTLGENFGHIFLEALASGCPLIISDRTPWLELEKKGIGWSIPLENPAKWAEIINYCINLDDTTYQSTSINARNFIVNWLDDSIHEAKTIKILEYALTKAS